VRPVVTNALLISLLVALVPGCSNKETPTEPRRYIAPSKPEKRTPLESKALDGVLKGKVVYDGDPPPAEFISGINDHGDKVGCLKGEPLELHKQTWVVNKDTKAVANIVVWLEPPPGKYFSLSAKDKDRTGEQVVLDQPHCAFVPHVLTMFPSYFDGAQQVKTGQKLVIKNSAPFLHTAQWNLTRENEGYNGANIPPNGGKQEFVLNPQKTCLTIGCGIHNWMHGVLWIFEHPYHAVSDANGHFQIKNVPTDVELTFKAWHETRINPFEERKMTFKSGDNPGVELKIKK
jgi:hypothetical protein